MIGANFHSSTLRAGRTFGVRWSKAEQHQKPRVDGFTSKKDALNIAINAQRIASKGVLAKSLRAATRQYTVGESVLNDFVVGAIEMAGSGASTATELLKTGKDLALKSGLGIAGPIGLGVLAVCLGVDGGKEIAEGLKERDAGKSLDGTRTSLLGAEAANFAVGSLFKEMAGKAAFGLGVAHIVVDAASGCVKLASGIKSKNKHQIVDGVSDLGLAAAWTVGMVTGPTIALPIAVAAVGVKIVNGRKERAKVLAPPAQERTKNAPTTLAVLE